MRPLGHLGIGVGSEDFNFYKLDSNLYDSLMERSLLLLKEAYKEFMGIYYNNPPKKTFKELKTEHDYLVRKLKAYQRLDAPPLIVEELENQDRDRLIEVETKMKNNGFGSLKDSEYVEYRKAYYAREHEWYESEEKEQLCKKIYEYNESVYNKLKQEHAR